MGHRDRQQMSRITRLKKQSASSSPIFNILDRQKHRQAGVKYPNRLLAKIFRPAQPPLVILAFEMRNLFIFSDLSNRRQKKVFNNFSTNHIGL